MNPKLQQALDSSLHDDKTSEDLYIESLQEQYDKGTLKLVNCAECGCELIPRRQSIQRAIEIKEGKLSDSFIQPVAGTISFAGLKRHYCFRCLT